jgi:hypothetical protein
VNVFALVSCPADADVGVPLRRSDGWESIY